MEKARWIWAHNQENPDEYCEFISAFNVDKEQSSVSISCDGDYALYINGIEVATNQYGDYPHFKTFDEIDISPFTKQGENKIAVIVWHIGINSSRYLIAQAGVIFEVKSGNEVVCFTSENTLSRISKAYKSGLCKQLTPQIGQSFAYDETKEDNWIFGEGEGFAKSVEVDKTYALNPRPNKKLILTKEYKGAVVYQDGKRVVFDMGEEVVGLCAISFDTENEQDVTVCWSERLEENYTVPRIIRSRDFSFDYKAVKGKNFYRNPFLRLGCRYVELNFLDGYANASASIIRQEYPVQTVKYAFENKNDEDIYNLCLNSLKLCMMEHYVDCPWREQCLYSYDSRNQMLFGYSAFENGNSDYVKSNLLLMSKDNREDNLLEICYPSGTKFPIPSFSLYYALSLREYLDFTNDTEFISSVFDKLTSVLSAFASRIKDGLVTDFDDTCWSFYDWTPSNEGNKAKPSCNGLLSILFVLALNNYAVICQKLGKENVFTAQKEEVVKGIEEKLFDKESGLYKNNANDKIFTALAQAIAVLALDMDKERAEGICKTLIEGSIEKTTLSFKPFVYDALLKTDKKYTSFVLEDMRKVFNKMLDAGSTATWETEDGYKDFDNAGSLCHGWSAIAVHYFPLLGIAKRI